MTNCIPFPTAENLKRIWLNQGQEQEKAVFWTPLSCLTTYRMQGPFSMKERTPQTKSFKHSHILFQSVFTPTGVLLHHPSEPEKLGDRPQAPQEGPHVRESLNRVGRLFGKNYSHFWQFFSSVSLGRVTPLRLNTLVSEYKRSYPSVSDPH